MPTRLEDIDEVESRLLALAGAVNAATAAMVDVIAEVLERELWTGIGFYSPEHWVSLRCGVNRGHAARLAAAARALRDLPVTRAAFAAGEITEDHVAAIARAEVTAAHDGEVADHARIMTVSQLRAALSCLPRVAVVEESPADAENPIEPCPQKGVWIGSDDDGMWTLRARLCPDAGLVVEKSLTAAREAVFHDRRRRPGSTATAAGVTWVDALVRLADVGLDGLDTRRWERQIPGHRVQVVIHWDPVTGVTTDATGQPITDADRRLLSCDAVIRPWFSTPGRPVALGRRERVVDDNLRCVIEHRDGGCVVPGCERRRWLTIHHLAHWEHQGPTDPDNLVALCHEHHRHVHRGELTIIGNPQSGDLSFTDAAGRPIIHSSPVPTRAPPAHAARQLGIPEPHWEIRWGERAQWKRWFMWTPLPTAM